MDVRCERCRTQYVFGDDQVGPDGLTVRCSKCGHVFLVKKKALVVTVPVKPGELREAPVSTAELNVAAAGTSGSAGTAGAHRRPPSRQAGGPREDAEKARPWSLRNRRGELYPFKDLSTLQKWIVERKAARDDEVSHRGGPWRRLGDMLELEPFFTLVERAERSAAHAGQRSAATKGAPSVPPTLIEFPPVAAPLPGMGHEAADEKTDRFSIPPDPAKLGVGLEGGPSEAGSPLVPAAAAVANEGPVMKGDLSPVSGQEPAWTAEADSRTVAKPVKSRAISSRGKRSVLGVITVLAALAGGVAAVYVLDPGLLGIRPAKPDIAQPLQPPEPAKPDLAPSDSPARVETAPARPEEPAPEKNAVRPPAAASPSQNPTPIPSAPPNPNPSPNPGASTAATANSAPTPATNSAVPGSPANSTANPGPNLVRPPSSTPHSAATATPGAPATPSASAPPNPTPSPERSANPPTNAAGTPPASAGAGPEGEEEAEDTKETPPRAQPPAPPKKAKAAPKRPSALATAAESQKPAGLKRLLADARRLRARGKPEAALRTYGQAVEIEPRNADALAGRGLCYLDLSQYRPAEASFQAALDADAHNAEALMGLAETYRYEGRRTEAVTFYQRYLAAHPDGEDAVAARSAIEALKE